MRFPIAAILLVPVAMVTGCDLFPEDFGTVELPIPLSSPSVDLDVGTPVGDAIDSSCEDPEAASCAGIIALCQAEEEDDADCLPPTLPAQFPREVTVDGTTTTAEDVLPEAVVEATRLKFAIPVDLSELLAAGGVTDTSQVENITFDQVALNWEENGLTFDAPALDVYIGPKVDGADIIDAEALITRTGFSKVGTVGVDTDPETDGFEVGQIAKTTGAVPLSFVSGGNEAFNEQLKAFAFTMVLIAPTGQELKLKQVAGDATRVSKPDGAAKLKLEGQIIYSVNLVEAAGISE